MGIKTKYFVQPVLKDEYAGWILKKHYAHRIPQVSYSYGLYDNNKTLQGVCCFGMPCRKLTEYWVKILELNRLVVNKGLGKNVLSYFVASTIKMLPRPICVVSYADDNQGHHGYIYQATNWIYTGLSNSEKKVFINGKLTHRRTLNSAYGTSSVTELQKNNNIEVEIEEQVGKHRYFMFLGNKKQIKTMKSKLKYPIIPYPKGDNKRYDASYEPEIQNLLF